jgi:hypothetical protein
MSTPMKPGQSLMSLAGGRTQEKIIKPGAGLIRAAQALADPRRTEGKFPFQWLYPGPNSRMAMPNTAAPVAIPQIVGPATSAQAVLVAYEVPDGFRFVLTDILMQAIATDWAIGSGQLTFSLQVAYSTGPRNVEFLGNLPFPLGTFERPWPLRGRLEFGPLEVLEVILTNTGIPTPGANDFGYAALNGFTYPNTEAN